VRGLLRAEWLKVLGRRANRLLFAFAVGFGPMSVLVLCVIAAAAGSAAGLHDLLGYPQNLWTAGWTLAVLGPVVSSAYVASVVGCEFSCGAWPTLLARSPSRAGPLVAKIAVLVTTLVVLVPAGVLTWVGSASLVDAVTAGVAGPPEQATEPSVSLAVILVATMTTIVYGALALLVTVAARSATAGLVAGILAPLVFRIIRSSLLAWVLPNVHLDNVFAQTIGHGALIARSAQLLGSEVPAAVSCTVLAAMVALFVAAALAIFIRRDVS